jgi:hypothetical protein
MSHAWHTFGQPFHHFLLTSSLTFIALSVLHAKLALQETELEAEAELSRFAEELQSGA